MNESNELIGKKGRLKKLFTEKSIAPHWVIEIMSKRVFFRALLARHHRQPRDDEGRECLPKLEID
ncbi:MAG: ribosomal protein L39E [Akkermansiaceae bacterium]|jgi:ribosomal protein L39E